MGITSLVRTEEGQKNSDYEWITVNWVLNTMTIEDRYLLPMMDECRELLGSGNIFTSVNAYSGYWKMLVKEEDKSKTAFVCHSGTF